MDVEHMELYFRLEMLIFKIVKFIIAHKEEFSWIQHAVL